ncbi:MAG: 2-oxoacid:acceptor oxidoreductase family protein [Desulfovibrionaceae bacterium]
MLRITCAGFGGQGVLTAGLLLAHISMMNNKKLTWVPSYGSEMRGGTASCRLRIGDTEILNPFFSKMDVLLAMNGESVDIFGKNIAPGGLLVVNSTMVGDVPPPEGGRIVRVPATALATQMHNARAANIVILGATIAATGLFAVETFADGIDQYFGAKGKNNPLNRQCFLAGAQAAAQ